MRGLVFAALVASLAACNGGSVTPVAAPPATPASSDCGAAPNGAAEPALAAQIRRVYQPDWAGPVLFAPGQVSLRIPEHRFCAVEGEWVVPYAKPTINCSNPHESVDGSSLWIAIDGWSGTFKAHERGKDGKWHIYPSTDILQAGSESDVRCYHGGSLSKYRTTAYFWIEWSGVRNVRVTRRWRNLPLNPGDTIYVRIAAATSGPRAWKEATLWLVDETTGKAIPPRTFHSGCIDCGTPFSRPATLFGNTVEWITEATFYDADNPKWPNTLDDFGNVEMAHVDAVDQNGIVYDLAHPHGGVEDVDWMTWNGLRLSEKGVLLACTTVDAAREATFSRAPYVIATPGDQGELKPRPKNCK